MPMPIETTLNTNNLQVLSDLYIKMTQEHNNITSYFINYRRTNQIAFIFGTTTEQTQDYNKFILPYYNCNFSLKNPNTNEDYTSETFDFETTMSNCTYEQGQGSLDIPLTYNSGSSVYRYYASNFYSENYLNYEEYKTITIEPSPSPEPEEPTGEEISPYYFIIPSFILMLLLMYKFLDKIFARGD